MSNKSIDEIIERYLPKIATIINTPCEITYNNDPLEKTYNYRFHVFTNSNDRKLIVTWFTLVQMPGCCGICISTKAGVAYSFQKQGLGNLFHLMRIEIARALGYGILMCTDVESNVPQQKILTKNNWKKVDSFKNPRTKNQVAIHTLLL